MRAKEKIREQLNNGIFIVLNIIQPLRRFKDLRIGFRDKKSKLQNNMYSMISFLCGIFKKGKEEIHRYREQIGGCKRYAVVSETDEGAQKARTSSF